jgi:membrane protease subunit HflC
VNDVARFDKRIITQLYPSERFLTREQEQLNVDFYVKWRIDNLRKFYEATGGTEDVANARLGETIKDSIKSVVTQRTLQQVITADRREFTDAMMKNARAAAEQLGVQLVDVRDSVFDRMRATFKAQAAKLRAEGVETSERTRAEANKQQTEILADAARQAGQIRGEGDASASEIYAQSYSKNAEFYSFYRSMQSYRESVGTASDIMVVSPDSAYFKYYKQPQPPR